MEIMPVPTCFKLHNIFIHVSQYFQLVIIDMCGGREGGGGQLLVVSNINVYLAMT